MFRNTKMNRAMCAGGMIVCHGADCSVMFSETRFVGCTVVALQGAKVTFSTCTSTHSTNEPIGVSIFASGTKTVVKVESGTIIGGAEGVVVHKGASVDAISLAVSRCFVAGIECRDPGSSIELMGCTVSNFSQQCIEIVDIMGVLAQAGCKATITECLLDAVSYGVDIQSKASASITKCRVTGCRVTGLSASSGGKARIADCIVQGCGVAGVHIFGKDTFASVTGCELSGIGQHGVLVSNSGRADVQRCKLLKNGAGGAWVSFSGVLMISGCSSIENGASGYWAESGVPSVLPA
jgi:Right handed beta helix region